MEINLFVDSLHSPATIFDPVHHTGNIGCLFATQYHIPDRLLAEGFGSESRGTLPGLTASKKLSACAKFSNMQIPHISVVTLYKSLRSHQACLLWRWVKLSHMPDRF